MDIYLSVRTLMVTKRMICLYYPISYSVWQHRQVNSFIVVDGFLFENVSLGTQVLRAVVCLLSGLINGLGFTWIPRMPAAVCGHISWLDPGTARRPSSGIGQPHNSRQTFPLIVISTWTIPPPPLTLLFCHFSESIVVCNSTLITYPSKY